MRIVCAGAGPGGLFFALLMKQRHPEHDVEVRERKPQGLVQGWGVVLWQDGVDAVTAADPTTGHALAAAVYKWHGVRISRRGELHGDDRASGFAIARRELQALLAGRAQEVGVKITYECEINPTDLPFADLIVAADGVRSRLRDANSVEFDPLTVSSRNRYVWLGVTRCLDSFSFGFVQIQSGWLWYHAYGHGLDRSTLIVECPPETWDGLGLGDLSTRKTLALLEDLFASDLGGASLLPPPDSGDRMPWLTFATLTNRTWHSDHLVLLGDAAHTTHFSIGSGTRLAFEDAIELVHALESHGDLEAALDAYEAVRRPDVERAQRDARHSLRWFEDISRYSDQTMAEFVDLLQRRRSSLQGRIPLWAYLRLRHIADVKSAVKQYVRRLRAH